MKNMYHLIEAEGENTSVCVLYQKNVGLNDIDRLQPGNPRRLTIAGFGLPSLTPDILFSYAYADLAPGWFAKDPGLLNHFRRF